jgi:hypothetical protein
MEEIRNCEHRAKIIPTEAGCDWQDRATAGKRRQPDKDKIRFIGPTGCQPAAGQTRVKEMFLTSRIGEERPSVARRRGNVGPVLPVSLVEPVDATYNRNSSLGLERSILLWTSVLGSRWRSPGF